MARFAAAAARTSAVEKPLRDELLSTERLEHRALSLAASLTLDPHPRHRALDIFPRFEDNVRVLRATYRTLADDVHTGQFVVSAADWLLDNFHLITRRLAAADLEGEYGFFDAIDYTQRGPDAVAREEPVGGAIVQAYMAHHEGMTLVALTNALLGDRMVERFHAEPRVQATELLLKERVPRHAATIEPRPLDEMRVAAPVVSVPVRLGRPRIGGAQAGSSYS